MAHPLPIFCTLLVFFSTVLASSHSHAFRAKYRRNSITSDELLKRDTNSALFYPAYNLSVPIDHFHNDSQYEPHSNGVFNLRYFFDATYYKPGGPVIVLQGGETSVTDRLPYLQKGMIHQLASATHGIAVILEHRYYGTSIPTPNLTTEEMRFLTTDQGLADQAYFAQNVVFPGLEHLNLTAPNVAYIGYGGSYAGGFSAFIRKIYPDVFWGSIASSGVVEAVADYWQYFEPIHWYAPQQCMQYTQQITNMVDNLLIKVNETATTRELLTVFGFPNLTYGNDFAQTLSYSGVYYWQNRNWDPASDDPDFYWYCGNLTSSTLLYPDTANLTSTVQGLLTKGGYGSHNLTLTAPILNWIGYLQIWTQNWCYPGQTQDQCFGNHNIAFWQQDDITQSWRPWTWQYCTQWGYFETGNTPPGDLPLISRTNDVPYQELVCQYSFNITTPPNVTAINKFGGYGISYPRLAFIDGEQDPWRPATVHASPFVSTVKNRTSTIDEPLALIKGAVHHWDENGMFKNETTSTLPPQPVREAQSFEVALVLKWMAEWEADRMAKRGECDAC